MHDFDFYNPTHIKFGRNTENEIGTILANDQIKKVLITFGLGSIKRTGLLDKVITSLEQSGIEYVEFEGIKPNPIISTANEGKDLAIKEQVEAILAVGGGSVIDSSKAIAAAAKSGIDIYDFYRGIAIETALPLYTILTLSATGSEMNNGFVLTNEKTREKFGTGSIFTSPKVSILNPELTFSVPKDQTAYGAVDTISHAIEPYFTKTNSVMFLEGYIENICFSVTRNVKIALTDPTDYNARAELMWASTMALNGLNKLGAKDFCFPSHMIEHSLSALYDIAHGAGLAIILPAWLKYFRNEKAPQIKQFAKAVFNVDDSQDGIKALENWLTDINAPIRLSDVGIPADDIEKIAENAFRLSSFWGMEKTYNQNRIVEILSLAI